MLEHDRFQLVYQPIVSTADAEVTVNISDSALADVLTADVVWRITWDGGMPYVPTATHTMGVFS